MPRAADPGRRAATRRPGHAGRAARRRAPSLIASPDEPVTAAVRVALRRLASARGSAVASAAELHRGRHLVVRAALANGEAYILKCGMAGTLAHERGWYRRLAATTARDNGCKLVDEALANDSVLVFAVHPAAVDARAYAIAHQRLPPAFGAGVARRLAILHALDAQDMPLARIAPAAAWRTERVGVRADRLLERCAQVQSKLSAGALVHGDVRWENIVVVDDESLPVLIDWEDAGRGEPAWDVGCLLASFAAYAIRADALFGTGPGSAALHAAMHAHTAAAWNAYAEQSPCAGDVSFLNEVVRCAGVRLAETALAPSAAELTTPETGALIDAALEMLDDPMRAAATWYGVHDPVA